MSNIYERIEKILKAKKPINLNGKSVVDLKDYKEVYADGRWSNIGFNIYMNTKKQLIRFNWSKFQSDSSEYSSYTLEEYLGLMPHDVNHFERWVNGLRYIVLKN